MTLATNGLINEANDRGKQRPVTPSAWRYCCSESIRLLHFYCTASQIGSLRGRFLALLHFGLTRECWLGQSLGMARKLRLQYPGAIYHLMSRGDRREPVFLDDIDRRMFLTTLAEACAKTDWQVHAYCLMNNHFHLVVETPKANLADGMKWLLGTYTARFNRKHRVFGHLFSGRYKSLLVDNSGNGYFKTVCDYVHL